MSQQSTTMPTRREGAVTKRMMLVSGGAHPALAEALADHLDTTVAPRVAHVFANGETFVRFEKSLRGCDVFLVQSFTEQLNTWLMEALITVDALKRASAKRITVILPFYPYGRQDKKHRGREPISARLVSDLFATAGANRLMSVDLHTAQTQGFFNGPVDHLLAQPLLADHIRRSHPTAALTVVAPDSGRVRLAERWADLLGGCPIAFIQHRDALHAQHPDATQIVGDVEGRLCVVVDDMIDTGATMTGATRLLLSKGAFSVVAAATHGVFSGDAVDHLAASGIHQVVVTDTVPIPFVRRFPQLTVLPIAPLLAKAIRAVFDDGSVTNLFDGHA
ncbi:ribose-phosphate diphosphokinase [Amycolatopsis sp. RTGN1]|uniref:ribose-phosphate diphosphokinase n=1 Tax=Amycolatopsis ponsaeliensis TaxID=2992142 RepID=UPI002549D094|nr:ribose-phosphate diphosphokinase [Amycolatopsis sp. RTGN1]